MGCPDSISHFGAVERDEGYDIDRAYPRMDTFVSSHVNEAHGFGAGGHHALQQGRGLADYGQDRPVVVRVRTGVQKLCASYGRGGLL